MRKIAPETDKAHITSATTVVALARATRAKPPNNIASQNNNTAKKGSGIELPRYENRRNRAWAESVAT
jgi:hypothetical protein